MEIRQLFYLFKRWIWLIITGLVLGMVTGYVISSYQIPEYQTTSKVMVSSSSNGQLSNPYSFYNDQRLAQTYSQLLKTSPVLEGTGEYLGYGVRSSKISAQPIEEGSPIIKITVESYNPQKAADIANTLVQVLIEQNDIIQSGQFSASEESLQVQIKQVEDQIAKYQSDLDNLSTKSLSEQISLVKAQMDPLQAEVAQLQQDIALLTPAWNQERKVKIAEMEARLDQLLPLLNLYQQIYTNLVVLGNPGDQNLNDDAVIRQLQSTLELYQQIYLNLINSREALRLARLQNTPNVVQIQPASVPSAPIRPRPVYNTGLGGVIGLLITAGIAFLIEYFDDTIRTPEDVKQVLDLPVVGYIAEMNPPTDSEEYIYVARQPRSPVSEAFRSLRVNIEFAGIDGQIRTILVTSPGPSEGKTTIAANLAAIIAQGGKTSLLLDADLRRPRVHKILKIPNRIGLSDLFREHIDLESVRSNWNGYKGMTVITSGSLPQNPAELLGSARMESILTEVTEAADVVVIDTPPTLVTDAQVMASKVDAVLLVVQPGQTHADAALATLEQFKRADGNVLGVVFNRIPRNRGYYYGGYRYYSPYYYAGGSYHYSGEEPQLESTKIKSRNNGGSMRSRISKVLTRKKSRQEKPTEKETQN